MKDAFGVERISKIAWRPVYHGTTQRNAARIIHDGFKPSSSFGKTDPRGKQVYLTGHRETAQLWGNWRPKEGYNGFKQRNGDDVPVKGTHQMFNAKRHKKPKPKQKFLPKRVREQADRKVVLRSYPSGSVAKDPNTEGFMTDNPLILRGTQIVTKSFVTGVGFKPITQMAKPEIEALRAARSIRAQGGRGHLGQLIGGPGKSRVTPADAAREKSTSAIMQERKAIADGTTTSTKKVGSGKVFGSYDDNGGLNKYRWRAAGNWAPTSGTGPQRRNKGLTLIRRGMSDPSRRAVVAHEVEHSNRAKPKSAFLRMNERGNGPKRFGDEARADHAMPAGERDGLYREAAMSHNPIKRFKARRQIGTYAGATKQERRQSYKKYKTVTRRLEGIERQRAV
jgi:hypothetical protein